MDITYDAGFHGLWWDTVLILTLGAGVVTLASLGPQELAPRPLSRLLKALAANSAEGLNRIACRDPELVRVLGREGLRVEAEAPLAWAATEEEVLDYARAGKLVLCANPDWVRSGAAVVVQAEGGRPVYVLYQEQARRSRVYLRAVVYHYAKERR